MNCEIIAILRGIRAQECEEIAAVLLQEGIDRIEVPLNSPDPFESIGRLQAAFGDRALIGAGTVLEPAEVEKLAAIGAQLVVSPDFNAEVVATTKAAGMLSYPGVFTATECFAALRAGADALKLFPAQILGPHGLSALRAVLPPQARLLAVGGVGGGNFADWRNAGADGFGIGSALYQPGDSAEEVRTKARRLASQMAALS
ncbi:2-dehydro-3-deoxy-6-phosphogalactonate aldolase [Rhodovulum sp. 12E13]|uniref:2-dehydro-3-deoxy-6-phosphogalactonate aldolase n=1 Tax=Rhodovulum sp. 12E13 TaxID=2203891 RepID=UPI000E19BDE2|nr:2-dehydro-3-deoxy-6-phosphogalactonate aldolase [Rhodovulum sp. 12E13]RDC69821.1 2-dehydro-3-deoxy-6-phosphogalactonate aldolase [Rhodovulum sp. 12E13]